MGLALCRKHGETGIVPDISIDICRDQSGENNNNVNEICIVCVKVFDGGEHLFDQKNYISKNVFDQVGMQFEYVIRSDEDEEKLNAFFPETSGMCAECFKEYISSRNIKLYGGDIARE
ncbi:hypothetical protein GNX18_06910 [Microbulbifer sp. SH-1]|uniref:hypothetical protein n=1 Tax=Microbulbifer sp. SH-1 TaxID=2681547 RepID=UPI0014076417|nr:hypothetical protein [Microbulbifer sp. SH-1]QIL89516.1 hypothetical protein GNX18_06910 [Microbulbifer sp. SH-1]